MASLSPAVDGYYNPILSYGIGRFVTEAAQAGADGLIVPDLPPEEAGDLEKHCRASQLALVFLVAPTSTPERLALVAAHSTGFLYLVSLTGVTGRATRSLPDWKSLPLACAGSPRCPWRSGLGFLLLGRPSQVGRLAEGVIVGSALIRAVGESREQVEAARLLWKVSKKR